MKVKDLILMVGIFHCISCYQLPWPAYDSTSSASSHKAASNKYFHQNAYSNDGNKEEHSSTTYLDGHNSSGDNANAYSEPRLQQPTKMLTYITSKLPSNSFVTVDSIFPAPIKKQPFGDQLFPYFPIADLVQSFSLPKQPLVEIIPATFSESLMEKPFSPVVTIEPVLSVLKKPSSMMECEPNVKQEFTGFSDTLDKYDPVKGLLGILTQNSDDDKADTTDSESVSLEPYKTNMGNIVFGLLDDDDDDDDVDDVYISSISVPELDELIILTEEAGNTDKVTKNAEVIVIPSGLQTAPYGSIPMYPYIPNYYMQPYPMISIQPNSPSNEYLYASGDMLPNDPVPMKEVLLPELLYGNLPLQNGMSPYYESFIVQQYPTMANYHQEANSNKVQGAAASASPSCATSDSLSRSTSYTTNDLKRL